MINNEKYIETKKQIINTLIDINKSMTRIKKLTLKTNESIDSDNEKNKAIDKLNII